MYFNHSVCSTLNPCNYSTLVIICLICIFPAGLSSRRVGILSVSLTNASPTVYILPGICQTFSLLNNCSVWLPKNLLLKFTFCMTSFTDLEKSLKWFLVSLCFLHYCPIHYFFKSIISWTAFERFVWNVAQRMTTSCYCLGILRKQNSTQYLGLSISLYKKLRI